MEEKKELTLSRRLKEVELELTELEDYIRDFWQFSPVPLAYLNPRGIAMDANNALAELMGISKEDFIGHLLSEFFVREKEIREIEEETMENGYAKNREASLKDREGKEIPVSLSTMVRRDHEGSLIGYFASFIALADIKNIQQQLEKKVAELKQFHDLTVGRELKMIELEKEVNALLTELGRNPKYK